MIIKSYVNKEQMTGHTTLTKKKRNITKEVDEN